MSLTEHREEIISCNRCGFCQAHCPIFQATAHEEGVARGRVALLSALIDGDLPWERDLEESLFTCLLCGACTASCFPAVPVADMVLSARQEFLDRAGRKTLHRLLFEHLLPYPGRLRLSARLVATAQKKDVSRLKGALGLLRFLGRDFPESVKIPGPLPAPPLRDRLRPQTLTGQGRSLRLAYFVGCGMDIVCPDAALDTLSILQTLAKEVDILPNCCCGLPAETYGDRRVVRRLAEKNLRLFSGRPYDLIVTDCSSCAGFLKKYDRFFPEDAPEKTSARYLAERVRDLVEFLDRQDLPRSGSVKEITVTYHDPCHALRGQGLQQEPRRILQSLPGVRYRELKEADWCCGGAGSYSLKHYQLTRRVLDRKIGHVQETGADLVVSSCPSCLMHLNYGCRLKGLPVRAVHISQLIKSQLTGLESPIRQA